MKILNQQIFENREAAALPGLMESGGLPALVSGLSGIHRVNLAAALYERLELPLLLKQVHLNQDLRNGGQVKRRV